MKTVVVFTGVVAGALATGWIGLRTRPKSFPRYALRTPELEKSPLPPDLPQPVKRYFRAIEGQDGVAIIDTAVLTGTLELRISGLPMRGRFCIIHEAGKGYRHYLEATFFGWPVLKVNEWYLDGVARLELPFGTVENDPKVNQAANLGLWAESVWLPGILVTHPRVRWEPVDGTSSRLVVPFDDASEDRLHVTFDPHTGLIRALEGQRFKGAEDAEKTGWRTEALGWRSFHGVRIPSPASVTWADEGPPWSVWTIEDVAYNVDVSAYIRQSGL
jgi:hypothetical protein